MKKLLLSLSGIALYLASAAQCSMIEVPLAQRASSSTLIVEGKVVSQHSFWNTNNTMIYTSSQVEVYKIFKGDPSVTTIDIITEGGLVGLNKITVDPTLQLNVGDIGTFNCIPVTRAKNLPATRSADPIYEAYASAQGFIKYNLTAQTATDVFRTYHNIPTEIYTVESASNHGHYRTVQPFDVTGSTNRNGNPNIQAPSITSFSPTTVTAGTGTTITISGSGFGATQGSGTVGFKNADDGGSTYINPLQTQIVSWSNTSITVAVPSNAGTGTIQVTQGSTATSAGTLTVSWAHLNVDFDPGSGTVAYQTDHINDNGTGGYTWQMNANVDGNVAERAAFMRAFDNWRCTTGINWTIGANTAVNDAVSDGTNCICNDNANPLSAGILGVCYSYWSGCASGPTIVWYVNELDIIFDEGSNISPLTWDYGPGNPTGSQYDFESVCVHELGHGHQLGHVINNGQIMHYALTNGTFNRTLSANDIAGGNFVQAKSVVANVCGPGAMTNHTCGSAPVAAFSGTPTSLCAGGTVNYTDQSTNTPTSWSWTFQGGTPSTSTSQNPSVVYSTAGTYSVSLTATNATGSDIHSVSGYITVFQNPTASAASQTNISCNGGSNGAASVSVSGGTPAYSFNWTPGNPTGDGTASVTGLTATTWTCTVTDSHSCTSTHSFTITQPPAITLTANSQTNISCNGGSNGAASVNAATGGAGGYTYNWTPGNPTGDGTVSVTGLTAGTWTCTVTDANGCSQTQTFSITQPSALVNVPSSQTDITCNGGSDGAASVLVFGGTASYSYNWTPGNPTGDGTTAVSALTAGNYTCTATDAHGCVATATFAITQSPPLVLSAISQTNISCHGGSDGAAAVQVSGGTFGYTYDWTPGNPTGDGGISVSGLSLGTWTCTVTDGNGCTQAQTFNITQPSAVSITMSQTDDICSLGDGTATATPSGGISPYIYSWSPGGQISQTASNLSAATYTCTVTDNNGCISNASITVGSSCPGSAPVADFDASPRTVCGGSGTVQFSDLSTNVPTSWSWSFPGGVPSSSTQQNPSVFYASPGSYNVTLIATNAMGSDSHTMNGFITVANNPSATGTVTNVSCNGGSSGAIDLTPSGGTGPYTFLWNPSGQTTEDRTSLSAATYSVTVTDANGCTSNTSYAITQPTAIAVSMSGTNASCPNNDGTTTALASGGTGPYTYAWAPGGQTTATATALSAGTYTCTVTDANGCSNSGTVSITAATCAGTTHLTAASCGVTLTALNQFINCIAVSGATNYQYKFMQGATTITTYTRGNYLTNCDLSVIPVLQYAQTYQVLVRAYVNNVWGAFGSSCNVTTPAFPAGHVSASSCGTTLVNMTDLVTCNSIVGATNYQWKFMQGATIMATYTRGTNIADCSLSNVVGVGYGQTYDVYVRAYEGGVWGPYGTSCTITTPAFPTTQVSATWCNGSVTNLSSGLSCDAVAGATNYQWKAVNGTFSAIANRGSNQTNWRMSWIPGTTVSMTYTVTVRAFVGNAWGPFGTACTVTIGPNMMPLYPGDGIVPSEVRAANPDITYPADQFTMSVYPNPFSENITVTTDADVQELSIFNSFGELVRTEEIRNGVAELHLGDLAAGIYLVQAKTTNGIVTQKIIKE